MQTSVYLSDAPRTDRSGGRSSHRAPSKVIRKHAGSARYPASQKTGKQDTNTLYTQGQYTVTGYRIPPDTSRQDTRHALPDTRRQTDSCQLPARHLHDTRTTPVISRGVRFKSESPHQSQSRTERFIHASPTPPCILEVWKKMGENRRWSGVACAVSG